ncbi:MAG: hypothetical protein PHQ43_08175 [Dehalococcoidales bacterium]|jgi:hypothetical protein|nr:hypothetical protein [Dehalococcoidales bacterium]
MEFDKAKIDSIRHEIEELERERASVLKRIETKNAELNVAIRTFNAMQGTKLPLATSRMGVWEKLEMAKRK